MTDIPRTPSGIPGVDEILEGGIPKGRVILLTGTAGSGKTTFGLQFLHSGATEHHQNGLFITLQEELSDTIKDMSRYGWDLEKLDRERKLTLIQPAVPFEVGREAIDIDSLLDRIHRSVLEVNAERLVFDSLAQLALPYADPVALRRDVMRLGALLRELGCTAFLITEMVEGEQRISRYGVEEFLTQGVIVLHLSPTYRALQVTKMRGTNHDTKLHRMRFTEKGLAVVPGETPF
jgi:KaiC/GvpD/RAD55 family RecA-like ATPase